MKIRLILGDQLSRDVPSLIDIDMANDLILMCEVRAEAKYVKHHKKKIAFLFSAMRHFAQDLRAKGFNVRYTSYDDPENAGSLLGEVARAIAEYDVEDIIVTSPGEHRLLVDMQGWAEQLNLKVSIKEDTRFLSTPSEFAQWAKGRKQLRMEYFYREMRRKYSVLMNADGPIGGQWNYDAENRKPPLRPISQIILEIFPRFILPSPAIMP